MIVAHLKRWAKMKFPLIFAHGQEALLFVFALGVGATVVGLASVVLGVKRKDRRSTAGIALGVVATLSGCFFCVIHQFRPPYFDLLMFSLAAPLFLGTVGVYLCFRRKPRPNKAPEPTP